jgi:hypothetical protein
MINARGWASDDWRKRGNVEAICTQPPARS